MISIREILEADHVNLAIASTTQAAAVEEVLAKLNGDDRVTDWPTLHAAVVERAAPALDAGSAGICIAHGRTNAVSGLVMAVGRSASGVKSPQISKPVRLIFVAGIPTAFDSEYLRVVGVIARLCRDKETMGRLLAAPTAAEFIDLLAAGEVKL